MAEQGKVETSVKETDAEKIVLAGGKVDKKVKEVKVASTK
jgi:hypothetical protein